MGTRGPAPTPAHLRILKGNGEDRDIAGRPVKPQPQVVRGAPDCPDWLPELASDMWARVVPELDRMGLLGQVDIGVLEAYCRTYAIWRGHDGERGYPTLTMTLVNLGSKLGLDPAARLRMTLPEAKDNDDDFVFGTG